MKTLVIQSFRSAAVPRWIEHCLTSVREWARAQGFDYRLFDDRVFELCGPEYLARAGNNMRAIMNLARLELIKDAHQNGYDRAIWIDADVLVFHPELFKINVVERYAFVRETWVTRNASGWRAFQHVNNSVFVCMKNEPDLDMLIRLVRHIGIHRPITKSFQTGTYLLTGLEKSLAFETLDDVGMFSSHVVLALARQEDPAVSTQAIGHGTPVFAANLCASDRDPPTITERQAELVVERLMESKGDVVNRWLLKSPDNLLNARLKPGMVALFPHEVNVRLQFRQKHGRDPDLVNPKTFNEKIAARKLNLTDDVFRLTADKYAVRRFVSERVGDHVLIPLIRVYEKAEEVDFDALPTPFILKPTHGSGWKELVLDKSKLDREAVRATMRKWLRSNFFHAYFEIHYRDIPPRIVAETLLQTKDGGPPEDFRFTVIRGRVCTVTNNINSGTPLATRGRYDRSWRPLAVTSSRPQAPARPPPLLLAEMIDVAENLGEGFDFVRIDLYLVDDKIYFGEITHTPTGGLSLFTPRDFDLALGKIVDTGGDIPDRYYVDSNLTLGPGHVANVRTGPADAIELPPWTGPDRRVAQFNSLSNFRISAAVAVSQRLSSASMKCPYPPRQTRQVTIELGAGTKRRDAPLVSCLMVSQGKPERTRFSIDAYKRQSWTRRELVIVDRQGDSQLVKAVEQAGDDSIRIVSADNLAEPLARALAAARGTYVCLWEDGALHHPARIEAQFAAISATKSGSNALDRVLCWNPRLRRLSLVREAACDLTILARRDLLSDPAASESAGEMPGAMRSLVRAASVSYLDLPELFITVAYEAHPLGHNDNVDVIGYETTLDLLGRSFPIADVRQQILTGAADLWAKA